MMHIFFDFFRFSILRYHEDFYARGKNLENRGGGVA